MYDIANVTDNKVQPFKTNLYKDGCTTGFYSRMQFIPLLISEARRRVIHKLYYTKENSVL